MAQQFSSMHFAICLILIVPCLLGKFKFISNQLERDKEILFEFSDVKWNLVSLNDFSVLLFQGTIADENLLLYFTDHNRHYYELMI